jgi:dipeptidyl aminopeptidase/acylaminoacyl peptidase
MIPIRRSFALLAVCLLAATASGAEPIVTTDLLRIRTAGDVDLSADGRRAVYVVTSMGEGSDGELRYFHHLWLAELGGPGEAPAPPRQLTHGERADGSPVLSPDGSAVAFVRASDDEDGEAQIWILPLSGGEAWRLTDAEFGAGDPVWSPDGDRLLYTSEVPAWALDGEPPWNLERPGRDFGDEPNWRRMKHEEENGEEAGENETGDDAPEADPDGSIHEIRAWLAENAAEDDPRVLTRLDLQGEHELAGEVGIPHLFVIDAAPGVEEREARQLTDGFQAFGDGDWTPDGRRIVAASVRYPEHPDRVRDGDLYLVNADGSGAAPLLDWEGWTVFAPEVSPGGETVAFLAMESDDVYYAPSLLMMAAMPTGDELPEEPLTRGRPLAPALDDDADDLRWTDDGAAVYVSSRSRGTFPIYRVPLDGGEPTAVVAAPGSGRGVRSYDLAAGRLVYAATEVANPNELYTAAADGSGERRLTELNSGWLADKEIVHPTQGPGGAWIERPDGTRVQYWTVPPAGLDEGQRYPLVLAIHGGPSAMWGPGEFTMWHEFQLLAARGYGIVYANPRGSGGYGYDFKKANYQDWGAGPAGDLLAALDEAAELSWVDPEKRFVVGGSYAGYMTAWIVGHDQRFDAAVAQRGVYDLSFFFGEGNAWRLVPYHMGGYPWEPEARAILDRESPLTYVEEIRTPLLVIHSDRDRRTGVNQSEMLYKALKVLERPVEYVRYPEEGHDLSRSGHPKRRMDRLNRIVEFFERYRE